MKVAGALVFLLAACVLDAAGIRAQAVRGRVTAAADGRAVAHALVVLMDAAARQRGGALTDSTGAFHVRADAAGTYRVAVERIGYASAQSEPMQLGAVVQSYDVVLSERPLALESLRAESGGRGCAARADAAAVYGLWSEIEKALRLAMFTQTRSALSFATMLYERELDSSMKTVLREQQSFRRGLASEPFRVKEPAELMSRGFSQPDGTEFVLHGLDARVLLSSEFMEHYCFRIQSSRQRDLIGLAFQPVRRRDITDVRGVLWVDRATAELRYLAYEYINPPPHIEPFGATSEVHFRRLSNGLLVIEHWWIRTPRVAALRALRAPRSGTTFRLEGYREDGGVLLAAEERGRAAYHLVGGAALTGRIANVPRAAAPRMPAALLSGTPHGASIREDGTFEMIGLPEGEYVLAVRDAVLDELRVHVSMQQVRLLHGSTVHVELTWPSPEEILRAACPGGEEVAAPQNRGLLYGTVLHPETGQPRAGADVRVEWQANDGRGTNDSWRTTRTDALGSYRFCWLPDPATITLRVAAPGMPERSRVVDAIGGIMRADIR